MYPSGEKNGTIGRQVPGEVPPGGLHCHLETNPNLYPIVAQYVIGSSAAILKTSFENEPKTRNQQIQEEIRMKRRPNLGSKTNPNEPSFWPIFGEGSAQNQRTNPTNPRNKPDISFRFNEFFDSQLRAFNRSCRSVCRFFTVSRWGPVWGWERATRFPRHSIVSRIA
jgi:hypothetical protein